MSSFCVPADVRGYLNITGTSGQYSDGLISSNIKVASAYLQSQTGRQFDYQAGATKLFTTRWRSAMALPDYRNETAVVLNQATLTKNSTYYAIPDRLNSGTYVGIEFPNYGRGRDYRTVPDWFDRGLDSWYWTGPFFTELPNNLSITADWGFQTLPDELVRATAILASWYTLRSNALLSNTLQTPEGSLVDVSAMPAEISLFIDNWKIRVDSVVTAG